LALELGSTFVARSFSGDKSQLVPLIKAGMSHPGFAFIDVVSPCVTFNNNKGSTKSYDFVREHREATSLLDFVPHAEEITTNYPEGEGATVSLHDGSTIQLQKLSPNWDPTDRNSAANRLQRAKMNGKVLTGLLYIDPKSTELHDLMGTTDKPLNKMTKEELCPGSEALEVINQSFR